MPLHPKLVHLPMALAMILPLLSGGVWLAWVRRGLPRGAFVIVVAMQALLAGSAIAASQSGEAEEHVVEPVVGHDAIEAHEQAANGLVACSLALLLLGIAAVRTRDEARARTLALVMTFGTLASALAAYRTGEAGGRLVYELGAADAHRAARPTR